MFKRSIFIIIKFLRSDFGQRDLGLGLAFMMVIGLVLSATIPSAQAFIVAPIVTQAAVADDAVVDTNLTASSERESDSESTEQLESPVDIGRTLQSIYAETKTAKSGKDFSNLVLECTAVLESVELEKDLDKAKRWRNDAQRLLAWSLCKRGESRLELAISLRTAGNQNQFQAVIDAAIGDLNQSAKYDLTRWKTFFSRAVALANLQKYELAIDDLNQALELNPKSSKARFNRAELLSWQGNPEAAIEDYERVLAASANDVQAIQGLAHALLAVGEIQQAIENYTRVTVIQPRNALAWQARGEAHQAARNWQAAAEDYAKSLQIQKSGTGYLKAAWLYSTCPDPEVFAPQRAMEYAQQGQKYDSESIESFEVRAATAAANGEFATAVALQKQAIEKTAAAQDQVSQAGYQFDAEEMKVRLTSYQEEEPYRQPK